MEYRGFWRSTVNVSLPSFTALELYRANVALKSYFISKKKKNVELSLTHAKYPMLTKKMSRLC